MPTGKITKTAIDEIPYPRQGQVFLWDRDLKGFGVCISRFSKTFIVQRDVNGTSKRITIGRYGVFTPDQARKAAMQNLYLMAQGINPNEEKKQRRRKVMTLDELAEDFFKARSNIKPRTKKDYRYCLDAYLADWLGKPVSDITPEKFRQRYFYIGENNGKTCANNVRRILGAIINYGIAAHGLFDKNPVRIIAETKSAYPNQRRRTYIKPHQLPAWWKAVHAEENDTCRDYLLLVLLTGLRRNEAAGLRWQDIDFNDRTLTIPETKNGEALTLPLSDYLFDLLYERARRYGNYEFVFPGSGQSGHLQEPKKAVKRVKERSGVNFTIHDLRRTFITIAESLDISMYALKRLINHKITNDITGGYIVVDVERLREPVEKVAGYVLEQVGGSERKK